MLPKVCVCTLFDLGDVVMAWMVVKLRLVTGDNVSDRNVNETILCIGSVNGQLQTTLMTVNIG